MIQFTSKIKTVKAEIGIGAWQEQSDVAYPDNRHVSGAALFIVKLIDLSKISNSGAERDAQAEVEIFLGSEEAAKLADAYDLGYVGDYRFPTIQAGDDTFFVWVNWTARRDLEVKEAPGTSEWFGSRGVPTRGTAH
jgi:hypothetical protein